MKKNTPNTMAEQKETGAAAAGAEPGEESSEASIAWLREHGVTVETPADRLAEASLSQELSKLSTGAPGTRTFTYVKVPCADGEQMTSEEAVVYADARGNGDQLPRLLKPNFSSGQVDAEALRRSAENHLGSANAASVASKVSPASIAAGGGAVETWRLADGVNIYLDEVGSLKQLPLNRRAQRLAAQCGFGEVPFFGDVFVGRVDGSRGNRNADLPLSALDPGSADGAWLQTAAHANMARQAAEDPAGHRVGGMTAEELNSQGGEGAGYTWSQTGEEVEVTVALPLAPEGRGPYRAKECAVRIEPRSISIKVPKDGSAVDVSVGKLFGSCRPDDSTWTIDDGKAGKAVVLTLDKAREGEVWSALESKE